MRYPNAWYVGDKARVRSGPRHHNVTIRGFRDRLVVLEYPDGLIGQRPYEALEPREEQDTLSYCTLAALKKTLGKQP